MVNIHEVCLRGGVFQVFVELMVPYNSVYLLPGNFYNMCSMYVCIG